MALDRGMMATVPMTADEFVTCVAECGPEVRQVIDEHRRDQGEILLHVLCGDLSRYCVAAWERGGSTDLAGCLACAAAALEQGDDGVKNAIKVSFVENVEPWDPRLRAFIETWPAALRAEADRQTKAP